MFIKFSEEIKTYVRTSIEKYSLFYSLNVANNGIKMLKTISYIIIFIFSLVAGYAFSFGQIPGARLQQLWQQYSTNQDEAIKLEALMAIGDEYYLENMPTQRDSVFQIALATEYGRPDGSNEKLVNLYGWYFSKDYAYSNKNAIDYARRMEAIGKDANNDEWLYQSYLVYYKIYFSQGQVSQALACINRAYYYANILNRDNLKTICLLTMGECQERANNKIDAFRNYMDALFIADRSNNDSLVFLSCGALSNFFRLINNYEKARAYNRRQLNMLVKEAVVDSSQLMPVYSQLANILYDSKEMPNNWNLTGQIVDYGLRHNDAELKDDALTIRRRYLIDNVLIDDLASLYTKEYPEELVKIKNTNLNLYYRMMAYIEESKKQPDSAAYYYQSAENVILEKSRDDVFTSNFLKRYGQFLLRQKDTTLAREKFEQSYQYALKARYFPYVIDATQYLDDINSSEKNFTAAYTYQKLNRIYTDSEASAAKENELLLLEIDNENKQHELAAAREKAAIERRHNIQDLAILLVITALFIILVMLGSFKVPKIVIKTVGFISFILFFEFIVILTDAQVESYTRGEPWKILLFKLLIISVLAPIHHYSEHHALNFLYEHKLIDPAKMKLRPLIARLRKKIQSEENPPHNDQ